MDDKDRRTEIQFVTGASDGQVSAPIVLGSVGVTVGVGVHRIEVPARQKRLIRWPDGLDHWTLNGLIQGMPEFRPLAKLGTVPLRRLRLPLDNHASDLLLVGDHFEEGGRYVQMEVPRGESGGWSWLDWDERYDLLAEEWRRLHEARESMDRAMDRPLL